MSDNDDIWVNCSCFYPLDRWNKLFVELKGLIRDLDCLITYDLAMNRQFGENLRLSLLVPKKQRKLIIAYIDSRLTSFFSSNLITTMYGKVIRMSQVPFPTSVVQFDLYKRMNLNSSDDINKYRNLSNCMISALKDVTVSYEEIATLSFYLQLCLLHICLKFTTIDVLIDLSSDAFKRKGFKSLVDTYDKSVLAELLCEIEKDSVLDQNCGWLLTWKNQLDRELTAISEHSSPTEIIPLIQGYFKSYLSDVRCRINFNSNITRITRYLIEDFVHASYRDRT